MLKFQTNNNNNSVRPTSQLDPDSEKGLMTAIANGQMRLAMEYMARVVGDLQQDVAELKDTAAKKVSTATTAKKADPS